MPRPSHARPSHAHPFCPFRFFRRCLSLLAPSARWQVTGHGEELRFAGEGMPIRRQGAGARWAPRLSWLWGGASKQHGDLVAKAAVVYPQRLTPRQREVFAEAL